MTWNLFCIGRGWKVKHEELLSNNKNDEAFESTKAFEQSVQK